MVQNNKVLTVSYGTFSCTLEGFEDSFDTMKAIAEYFRDLAADDRYFGAEPPQPDADMLARIAQREISRQVEARSSDGGIHLRAAAPALAQEQPAAAPPGAVTATETPEVEQDSAPQTQETTRDEDPTAPTAEPEVTPPDAPESLADAPAETPAPAVEDTQPEEMPAATAPAEQAIEQPLAEDAEDEAQPDATETDPADTAEAEQADAEGSVDDTRAILWGVQTTLTATANKARPTASSVLAETVAPTPTRTPAPAVKKEDTVPAADSIAAKLQRIRAVVAKTPVEEEDFTEDEHAEGLLGQGSHATTDLEGVLSATAEEDTLDSVSAEEKSISAMLDRMNLSGKSEAQAEDSARDADAAPATPQEVAVSTETPEPVEPSDEPTIEPAPAAEDAPREPVRPRRPVRGRLIRVKRAEAEQHLINATAEDVTASEPAAQETPAPAQQASPEEASSLSPEDEADLLAELAAVEADLLASSAQQDATQEGEEDAPARPLAEDNAEEDAAEQAPASRDILGAATADGLPEGDVSRLMAAADDRLNDADATSSRETYNQLRAAVAAAQADSGAEDAARREARARAFREDLASVVRPHRPRGGAVEGQAPSEASRPAPLKLVAEQRIDSDPLRPAASQPAAASSAASPSAPVRPRRVSSALLQKDKDDLQTPQNTDDSAFASYASEKGAVELQELLEAAASYMSFIEGRESFSRPQLINKVRMLEGQEAFNREDSLRSFGLLLREGKLKKAANGRFSVSSQIGFRPGNRAAG